MKIPFVKMHGNGNDFVIIDNYKNKIKRNKTVIKKLTNRRIGIGCDQLILIEKSKKYDVFMKIYNSNGSEAEMCGNAARCVASLLLAGSKKKEVTIETISTSLIGRLENNNNISISINLPKQNLSSMLKSGYSDVINLKKISPHLKKGYVINMGNPHVVFFVKNLDLIDLNKIGPLVENYLAFKNGVNLEIVKIISPKLIKVVFWERGAGITMSCGSGILSAFYASFKNKKVLNSASVVLPLGKVRVSIKNNTLTFIGRAEVTFLGEYNYVL